MTNNGAFLPTNLDEGKKYYRNFKQFEVIVVSGDPYFDHPLSGTALLARLLEQKGYKVGIIAQPETEAEFQACGQPKYFFCVTSGLLDSMLANYTPMLRKREEVLVPERALITYTQKLKRIYRDQLVVLGGVEATIRRFTHFDYKENRLRRGILHDSKADLLIHGNAERAILTLLERFKRLPSTKISLKLPIELSTKPSTELTTEKAGSWEETKEKLDLPSIESLTFRIKEKNLPPEIRKLPSFEECQNDKAKFSLLTRTNYLLPDAAFVEQTGKGFLLHNRPAYPLTSEEMDFIYSLPLLRKIHPESKNYAFCECMVEGLETSVVIGRGCWGSCNFCTIPLVQGKEVAIRSPENIQQEVEQLCKNGAKWIDDLTLPTLNMYGSSCLLYNQEKTIFSPLLEKEIRVYDKKDYCNQECVGCTNRKLSNKLLELLSGIEKILRKYEANLELRSALRHDIILHQKELFRKVMEFTTRLKIAPEHIVNPTLKAMNKGTRKDFELFLAEFKKINQEQHTYKRLVPYFIAAHPGTTMKDMSTLREFCEEHQLFVELTQIFTPTPGTASTASYYTGIETRTGKPVYVARTFRERKDQKNILLNRESCENCG